MVRICLLATLRRLYKCLFHAFQAIAILYYLLLALIRATIANWPKIPPGIWWHETLRNKLGLAVGVPLYELFWLWPYCLLVIGTLAALAPWVAQAAQARSVALLLGTTIGALLLSGYYLYRGHRFASHTLAGEPMQPSYTWFDWPCDACLLLHYSIAGSCVGWCYYQWLIRPKPTTP